MQARLKDLYFLAFSVSIGILTAIGAISFRLLIELFQGLFWPDGATFFQQIIHTPWWLKIMIPVAGGIVAGPIIQFLVPEARGPGVPVVIASVTTQQSTIRHRVTSLKALVTSFLIGCGASVGREGPVVQIGASIGSSLAQFLKLDPDRRRVCLACGAAAGIAATFNAPIAGTLFAAEIILIDIEIAHISHIIISAVTASVIGRLFLGEFPAFGTASYQLLGYGELGWYLLLGILAGLVSVTFVWLIYTTGSAFDHLRIPNWIKPAVGGLCLGIIGCKIPHVFGVGYESINLSLANTLLLGTAVLILSAKIVATSVCIGSGMSGGIFAPSLVLGASLGTVVALMVNRIMPGLALNPSDYALVGMGAVVAGTTLAPITAILTIFELTNTYQIILPLMIACIASAFIVRLLFGYSAYELSLIKQGVNIVRGHDIGILRHLQARNFMSHDVTVLPLSMRFTDIMEQTVTAAYPHFVITDTDGQLTGFLGLRDIRPYMSRFEELKNKLTAADIMTQKVVTLSADDNLETALQLFERHCISCLPVTEADNPKKVIGIFKREDLFKAYQERILKARILSYPMN